MNLIPDDGTDNLVQFFALIFKVDQRNKKKKTLQQEIVTALSLVRDKPR